MSLPARGTFAAKSTAVTVSAINPTQHVFSPFLPHPRASLNLTFSAQDALETIDAIGEVDVAYTHDAAGDDYVYDVWFKVT